MNCDDYFEDPETNAAHLESCASCRALEDAMSGELDEPIEVQPRPIGVDALPLAPWEGAQHRTWPLVAAGAAAVLILAVALFLAAGTPPLRGIVRAVASSFSLEGATKFFQYFGSGLHGAPAIIHVGIAVLFVAINTILFLLLRRAPKGLDV
ncbi:MAG TPA: hypothetical protein VGF28_20045 [Thermoanaerobaculia bacterium]|jgi:hypothetical protein